MMIYDELLRAAFVAEARPAESVQLPFERRQRARQRVTLASGREAGIVLDRGTVMRGGDGLRHRESGEVIAILAALEPVSTVRCDDRRELARIAYHLGNRHVPLEVGDGWVRYERDHVLDDMVRGLGGRVAHEEAPFEPEAGAYASNGHAHPHGSAHRHSRTPPHDHDRGHADADAHDHDHDYDRAHGHGHGHGQAQAHEPDHDRGYAHAHEREHGHDRYHEADGEQRHEQA